MSCSGTGCRRSPASSTETGRTPGALGVPDPSAAGRLDVAMTGGRDPSLPGGADLAAPGTAGSPAPAVPGGPVGASGASGAPATRAPATRCTRPHTGGCRTRPVPLPAMGNHRTHGAHVVWDWNGTLLDDIHTVIEATNASFAEIGLGAITLERYRELYCVPVPRFYERLMGRMPTDEEWAAMDAVFHKHYWRLAEACLLTAGAAELLAARRTAGRTQSLLSLAPHDQLIPIVRRHGIEEHFVRVDGRVGASHAGKTEHMVRHLAAMENVPPERIVVVGDAADDALAAAHVGAKAVLYTGGSHSRASLQRAGVPVVDSLAEAVEVAEELVG